MTTSKIDHSDLYICNLTKDHDISDFDCGIPDLNEFLIEDSHNQKEIMVNVTHICSYNELIVGYLTLLTDKIELKRIEEKYKEKYERLEIDYQTFPAIKLGRLAVCEEFQGNGIGSYMLKWVLRQSLALSEKVGTRFVTVDAYVIALDFYLDSYFKLLPGYATKLPSYRRMKQVDPKNAKKTTVPMYFDLYQID